ncbi:MAG: hypothetical protein WC371_05270, partial [Parachlamydiales bacterium]
MKIKSLLWILGACLLLTGPAFSASKPPQKAPAYLPGEPLNGEMAEGYNATARIDVKGSWDFFLNGSFIYWDAQENGLALGLKQPVNTASRTAVEQISFKYHPGFKVGLGLDFNHDDWSSFIEYTRLHGRNSSTYHYDPSVYTFVPFWIANHGDTHDYYSAKGIWKIRLDLITWDLQREYYVGKKLTFKSFFGLIGGIL